MNYKIFDTRTMKLLERMDRVQQEPHLSFSEREYAQAYVDRHINKSLMVVQDTLDKDIKKKLESSYGRISFVEDHPDGKGHYAIAKSQSKDSFTILNIRKENTNHITQVKHNIGSKREAFNLITDMREKDFKQHKTLDKTPNLKQNQSLSR